MTQMSAEPFVPEPYPFGDFRQSATLEEANRRLADYAHVKTQHERAAARERKSKTKARRRYA